MPTAPRAWALRGSVELFVIVVGVLIALSLENWWAEREERSLETEYVDALFLEAQSQIAATNANRIAHDRKHAALTGAARLLDAPFLPEKTSELFHGLFQGSGIPVVPEFSTAVFLDLQSSGRLRLIRDDELRRAAIAHYARVPAQLQRAQRWADATGSTLHSFISSRAPVGTERQAGPILELDWSGIEETELHEIGAEIHSAAEVRGYVNAQARLLEEERDWLEILTLDIERYASLYERNR
jgi:hypothetical protein